MKQYKVITENMSAKMFDTEDGAFEYIKEQLNKSGAKVIAPVIEVIEKGYESIKTFEDACSHLGMSQMEAREFCCKGTVGAREEARRKLEIITRAINEGWTPDVLNFDERKWYPWFKIVQKDEINPNLQDSPLAGLAYVLARLAPSHSYAVVGSRLCFKDEKRARHAAQNFLELYEIMLLG